ncbi:MAG: bifunctional UDP-N-acetylglucosamine diphosphorylase/glucosamine-1-phosphate N-acetyltransferase GlmU [Oscillospiraceae bacterium]|nr:bifunctional UDP-N-acetylglucosamine diphosphorylase/glucosamine-1-phosphate N-acetyltransferase GlmU [Oscillospiraceae bacterium]
MEKCCALILAAGDGKRMKSKHPKVLCQVLFRPMISWVTDACRHAGVQQLCAVLGAGAEEVRSVLPQNCKIALQHERLGTGHAVMCAREFLEEHRGGDVLILCGDAPFISSRLIEQSHHYHCGKGNAVTVISARVADPFGYGRILRAADGSLEAIVEQRDATEEQKNICEINSGAYWFAVDALLESLEKIGCSNSQGEYYLTDAVAAVRLAGKRADAYLAEDADAALGANDRKGLQKLNQVARRRVLDRLMAEGVDIPCEDGILVDERASVGRDTTLLPGTIIRGASVVGEDCVIGPGSLIENSTVGNGCVVDNTEILSSELEDEVKIGPYCRVRPGSRLCRKVKIGNFVEVKNAVLGEGTKSAHLTYIGDADVGANVNFGCGVVVVNYDGWQKHRTTVGDNVFLGCNTNLVAPVKVGDNSYTAAGSTVTKDVPPDSLVIARAPEVVKEGRIKQMREKFGKK